MVPLGPPPGPSLLRHFQPWLSFFLPPCVPPSPLPLGCATVPFLFLTRVFSTSHPLPSLGTTFFFRFGTLFPPTLYSANSLPHFFAKTFPPSFGEFTGFFPNFLPFFVSTHSVRRTIQVQCCSPPLPVPEHLSFFFTPISGPFLLFCPPSSRSSLLFTTPSQG